MQPMIYTGESINSEGQKVAGCCLAGGENHVQWAFVGDNWSDEEKQVLQKFVIAYILRYRKKWHDDMDDWVSFEKPVYGIPMPTRYIVRRRSWRFVPAGETPQELIETMRKAMIAGGDSLV
jgi:hypothetical protein